ncbi:long-chain fatty acid transport protein 2-like isoform X2 [Dendrobates tinctorius]|uniref:long-chain fatty acid transport protein 2-like isoform X2 n=1 Tax=Dendrobates tinctorius TaxID=92724 RepID=UPI003CCA68A7
MYLMLVIFSLLPIVVYIIRKIFSPYLWEDFKFFLKIVYCVKKMEKSVENRSAPGVLDVFLQHVSTRPHKTFILYEDQAYSYRDIDLKSNQAAWTLRQYGSQKNDNCVAVFMANEPAYIWLWLALSKLGWPMACLNYNIRAKSFLHCFQCSGAKILIAAPGLPKAALINQNRVFGSGLIGMLCGLTSEDVFYLTLPLYHSAGLLVGLRGCIQTGAICALRKKFSATQFWDDCRKYNITAFQYIGEILRYLCNTRKKDNDKDHCVRFALGNGVRPEVLKEFNDRFGKIRIMEVYGATEGNVCFLNYSKKECAIGRYNWFLKLVQPFEVVKFDVEKNEPIRDSAGRCIRVPRGETGLLIAKHLKSNPFVGYAGNRNQTEKKKLHNVLEKGDTYFNTGDLIMVDKEGFVFFQDRVGDTFRWKGENVATTEVENFVSMLDFIEVANVYGVTVPHHEGRIGMVSIKLKEGKMFDGDAMFSQVTEYLPNYARPRFVRIQDALPVNGTYKQYKMGLVNDGFNLSCIKDPLYFLDDTDRTYRPLDLKIYNDILGQKIKL